MHVPYFKTFKNIYIFCELVLCHVINRKGEKNVIRRSKSGAQYAKVTRSFCLFVTLSSLSSTDFDEN